MLKALDLFSNIGGHALGFRDAGIRTIGFVEIDRRRRALLRHYFPDVPQHGDIRTYAGSPGPQIVIGGPPCKRTSVGAAIHGKRDGESLWPEMLRVGLEVDTEWFVVEQPPGNAAWEAQVADDLARAGYHSARVEFAAGDLGAPYPRRRVFILACTCLARLALAWQAIPQEIDRIARAAAPGNPWVPGPPRGLRVADGLSGWLDRNAAVAAIGDSNPPAMAAVIGRAIARACV